MNAVDLSRRAFLERSVSSAILAAATLAQAGRSYSADNRSRLRMGVVGGGFGASFHWHEHPNCEVTGVNALIEDREPVIDIYESLAMTVPGIVAHQSALKEGEQLDVSKFESA